MSANINTYIGRADAWHQLGEIKGRFFTWAEICKHPGFDYQVFKSQLHDGLGRPVNAWGTFRWNRADFLANKKDAAIFLGAVGADYKVIPHQTGFSFMDELIASCGSNAAYETAGVLGLGEKVWGLADLAQSIRVGDDLSKGYLLFATAHDGSISYSFRHTFTRVVCQNTLSAALSARTRAKLTVRHTKNALQRIEDLHEALRAINVDVKDVEAKLNFLATRRVTREAAESLFNRLFPKTEKKAESGEIISASSTRRDNIIASILRIYESNDNDAFVNQRGTAYNLLNAVTNYVDHERGTDSGRALSATFGSGNNLKSDAFTALLAEAKDLPSITSARSIPTSSAQTKTTSSTAVMDAEDTPEVSPEAQALIDAEVKKILGE